jgi:hypothetical protein
MVGNNCVIEKLRSVLWRSERKGTRKGEEQITFFVAVFLKEIIYMVNESIGRNWNERRKEAS